MEPGVDSVVGLRHDPAEPIVRRMIKHGKTARHRTLEPCVRDHAPVQRCEWDGCTESGDYRAPRSRHELQSYRWFCLQHVREYNAQWNFYAGMTEREVEADVRRDTVWQRPSWPFGQAAPNINYHRVRVRTQFGEFDDEAAQEPARPQTMELKTRRALGVLDLDPPVTVSDVKARYKELVKRHHPDANNGDKASEERFKEISEAYRTVMTSFAS